MDSAEINEGEQRSEKKAVTSIRRKLFRSFFAVASSLSIFLLLSFSVAYVGVLMGNLPIWSPISVHSRCRIVSSSVDLRSSKVCELGLLNYKAKHVFYPHERNKYRCHHDYYWASVFKVEYIDHSGQARFALAEAPNEALPYSCRPSFGAALLTKDKFKVNETYECWYTLGISKVDINHEGLFNCHAENPSTIEMLQRYFILSGPVKRWRWDVIAGLVTGFMTAFLSITLIGVLRPLISLVRRCFASRTSILLPNPILLKRVGFFVVYFSFISWVTIQYVKRLGLS